MLRRSFLIPLSLKQSWVTLAIPLLWFPTSLEAAQPSPAPLHPGETIEHVIASEEIHLFRADLAAGHWLVTVEQQGIDIDLTATPSDSEPVVVDSPLDREGMESLLMATETPGSIEIAIRARERAAPPGRYEVQLVALADDSPTAKERIAAEIARTEAARSYAGGAEGRLDAIDQYRAAARHWHHLGENGEETRDLYCAAVLLRIAGKTQEALEASQAVLPRWQALGDTYWEAATLNEIGLNQRALGEGQTARTMFHRANSLWRQADQDTIALHAQNNTCLTFLTQGDLKQGLACYQPLFDAAVLDQEPALAATIRTNMGWVYDTLGEPDSALEHYTRASALAQRAGDLLGQAQILNNLAKLKRKAGDLDQALADYEQALGIFRELKKERWEGRVLNNIAYTYLVLGEPQQAKALFRESLVLRREVGDRRGEVFTLTQAGHVFRHLGDLDQALERHQEATVLAAGLGDRRIQAMALTVLGWTHLEMADERQALALGQQALQLLQGLTEGASHAETLYLLGRAAGSRGMHRAALTDLETSLELLRKTRHYSKQAAVLTAIARSRRGLGNFEAARLDLEAALDLIEDLRTRVAATDLKASFQGSHRETFEAYIDLQMALHQLHPTASHNLTALSASERARARSLRDLLNEAGANIHQGVEPTLLEQRKALGRRLNAKAERRSALLAKPHTAENLAEAELEVASALRQLDRVEAQIRRTSPQFAALSQPSTLNASEIQPLLDDDTLLLEYTLATERSFLWLVSSQKIESFELPPRHEIEALARRFHGLLSKPGPQDRVEQIQTARTLAEMLLGPVVDRLGTHRLVVVADGALHYVPFAVLPLPTTSPTPEALLLTQHEVTHLPSAAVLGQLRELDKGPRAPGWLAMIADPVTASQDSRLADISVEAAGNIKEQSKNLVRSSLPETSPGYPRLPGSRKEAEAILPLAPLNRTLAVLGFQANLRTVFATDLSQHRIVHFATHGVIDTTTPRLSGLVLSLFDSSGHPRAGFLRLHDIYNLKLNADLVVLSGCQTALGREMDGEGLVGLTRGFMYAGAARVLASLWRIEDRATAELMTRFYRSMWADGATPAAALRSAQLSIRQERRWQDPYYWGTFVLQGDD